MERLHIVNNKIIEHQTALFRDKTSSPYLCQTCVENISFFTAGEVSNLLKGEAKEIITPLGTAQGRLITGPITLMPVLRAGLAMLPSFQRLLPYRRISSIGMTRNKNLSVTLQYEKLPAQLKEETVIVLDTMLATGSTIKTVLDLLHKRNCQSIVVACIFATERGINSVLQYDGGVHVVTSNVNDTLDAQNYVYPGVGDSGDRLFGSVT